MNNPLDSTLRELNDCGCGAGADVRTPVRIENRPGLAAIAFRAGTHPRFKASLLAGLSSRHRPELGQLRTRDDDDLTIALLDGWALVADVLTFYSERIANESYLRTATERRSVLELSRAIGYELAPGVAASTWLAFTVEEAEGAPGYAIVPARTKVQSIPGPGEKPQVYETLETFEARKEWNQLPALARRFHAPQHGDMEIWLRASAATLRAGDTLLIVGDERRVRDSGSERWDFRRVRTVEYFDAGGAAVPYARVTLDQGLGSTTPWVNPPAEKPRVYAFRLRASVFGQAAPPFPTMPNAIKSAVLGWASDTPPRDETIPAEWPLLRIADVSDGPPGDAVGTGLWGEYFDGKGFETAKRKFSRTDAAIDFSWGAGAPDARVTTDTFSIRWTGWVRPPASGLYEFQTESDDGVRLWIAGRRVIDNWSVHAPTLNQSSPIPLEAGNNYDIRLEYFENAGAATIRLRWRKDGEVAFVTVPASALHPRNIHTLHLDSVQPAIVPGTWLVMATPGYQELYEVVSVAEAARTGFTLSSKTTRLTVRGENLWEKFNEALRDVTVFADSREVPWAERPLDAHKEPATGDSILLDRTVEGLKPGRRMLVEGRTTDGAHTSVEAVELAAVEPDVVPLPDGTSRALSRLRLKTALRHTYDPATVTVKANAAFATHGESVEEVLGSGDAARTHQRFVLKQSPLTYEPASTPSGGEPALEIWVDKVQWKQVPSLFARGPEERVYVVRVDDDRKVTVQFGDGRHGARLPTGRENVRAVYRKGVGREGLVKARQLSLLMTRPLGIKDAINPAASIGAADPQRLQEARDNAPQTVLTLDRVVSLRDYEDFARGYSGIAKALATWTWHSPARGVFLTLAGPDGAAIAEGSAPHTGLLDSFHLYGSPVVAVQARSYRAVKFRVAGTVWMAPGRRLEDVRATVYARLRGDFGFAARAFGQAVALSEVMAAIQGVDSVVSVDLDALYRGTVSRLDSYLPAAKPENGAAFAVIEPAELLTLDESSLEELEVRFA